MLPLTTKRPTDINIRRPFLWWPRNVYPFPNTGGDAVSGGTHSPIPLASAVGSTGRSNSLRKLWCTAILVREWSPSAGRHTERPTSINTRRPHVTTQCLLLSHQGERRRSRQPAEFNAPGHGRGKHGIQVGRYTVVRITQARRRSADWRHCRAGRRGAHLPVPLPPGVRRVLPHGLHPDSSA